MSPDLWYGSPEGSRSGVHRCRRGKPNPLGESMGAKGRALPELPSVERDRRHRGALYFRQRNANAHGSASIVQLVASRLIARIKSLESCFDLWQQTFRLTMTL